MSDFWQSASAYPFFLLLFSLLLWAIFGPLAAALGFALGLAWWLLHHLRHLGALLHWLALPEQRAMPEGAGLWEDVFSSLNQMMRVHRQERAEHLADLQQMEQATAALPEGVVILDAADRIEWCNPLAEQHFGLDSNVDIGQQITYLARQPEFVEYLAAAEARQPLILRGTRQDDVVLSIKLIAYGESKRLLISRDITQFERLENMRRDFVANVSHELRTPLTVVNGFVETLQDMQTRDSDMAQRALQLMGEQTHRMAHLVDDLLTLSRLENDQHPLHEEVVDVCGLLDEVGQEGRLLSHGRHRLELHLDCAVNLRGSRNELRSAFANLLSNAIRYTPDGGSIDVYWSLRDGQAVFSVRDSGIGIAPQHIARLTERFYRVDRSRSRETGGTGLGLAIVKHIALRHQAKLEIASEEGRGSTFSLLFPGKRSVLASG
ncbi:phosphate regulon sensor histidine kinase PhoR [Ferrigenium sp. UT5]|uniref:phosphate regulon sensor histidine kinase PhoR n=1 Tax=Ferrigenium sp. UT5 TaxID=3242105 RepID=UPI0035544A86